MDQGTRDVVNHLSLLVGKDRNTVPSTGSGRGINMRPTGNEKLLCKTATAIPARASGSAGWANDVIVCSIGTDGDIIETSVTIEVFNAYGSDVAAGAYITVCRVSGNWMVDSEDCS